MQPSQNCQHHIWLLSGTGDGLPIAKALISNGWKVSVSVASVEASLIYEDIALESLSFEPLEGRKSIEKFLENAQIFHNGFSWVIDATHPFALVISSNLRDACQLFDQPLIRYERECESVNFAIKISKINDLADFDLSSKRLLFAIGSRHLSKAVAFARESGADVFARVLPSRTSIVDALAAQIQQDHLAILRPLAGETNGEIEAALCRKWSITSVVCRESGGSTQKLWQSICEKNNLDLFLISKPPALQGVKVINSFSDLFKLLSK